MATLRVKLVPNGSVLHHPANIRADTAPDTPRDQKGRKLAHIISQRIMKDERFTGALGENILDEIRGLKHSRLIYNLNDVQMPRFHHNLFEKKANSFS